MNFQKKLIGNEVLAHLRKKIMLNQLEKGEHLVELKLSEELNVSRGPIREAISKLEAERLVETKSNGRTIVREFNMEDIKNLYGTRILLEKQALKTIKPELFSEGITKLNSYLKGMQDSHDRAVKNVDVDLNFHATLLEMSGNQSLIQAWLSLRGMIETLVDVTSTYVQSNQQEIIGDHRKVIEALENNEIEKAQLYLEFHLSSASDYYCEAFLELSRKAEVK